MVAEIVVILPPTGFICVYMTFTIRLLFSLLKYTKYLPHTLFTLFNMLTDKQEVIKAHNTINISNYPNGCRDSYDPASNLF